VGMTVEERLEVARVEALGAEGVATVAKAVTTTPVVMVVEGMVDMVADGVVKSLLFSLTC